MGQSLPLPALRIFHAAARAQSFRLAASDLLLTPSAVSHAIRKLERELGATLFVRTGRAVTLTHEGAVLLAHVDRGLDELWRGVHAVSARTPGLLRLHAAPSFAAQWLAPRLPRFLAAHPGLEVRLASGTDYRRFDVFDADIVYGERPADVTVLPLGSEVVTPLCAPALAAQIASPHDLLRQTLIESDNKRIHWRDWFAVNRLAPPNRYGPRFDRSFLAIGAAVNGLGVALESLLLAERELASGSLVQPLRGKAEQVVYTGHWLALPAGLQSRSLRQFTNWLLAELGLPPV